jgi:hypothetical protein
LAQNNLHGVERPLSAPGSEQSNAEEMLAELMSLVESSRLTPEPSQPLGGSVPESERTDTGPVQRQSVKAASSQPDEMRTVDFEPERVAASEKSHSDDPNRIELVTGRPARRRAFMVSALVLVGAAALGSIVWLERAELGLANAPSFIATTQSPTRPEPQSNSTLATSTEAGAAPGNITQPAQGKVVGPKERPIDTNVRASPNKTPEPDLARAAIGAAEPKPDAFAEKPAAPPVNTPAVAAPLPTPQPVASQSLDEKPALPRSVSPGSTPRPPPTLSSPDSGVAALPTNTPLPPVRPTPKGANERTGVAQRSTSELDLPTKLSNKSDAHVVVAKADPTGFKAPTERSASPQREASLKSEKEAKPPSAAQALTEGQAAPPAPPAAQHNTNPVVHAFTNMVGAVAGFIPFVPH